MAEAAMMASSLPAGMSLADSLPQLTHETELQKMLADEKMRSEQHKTHYQTLKAEHTRLQDVYISLQDELKSTIAESRLMQDKYKALLDQARSEIAGKHVENQDLASQTLSSQKLEILKMELQEEVEQPFREKFARLDDEAEKYRSEYNKLKYEYSFLKSEYDHERQEHPRVIEEMTLRHEAEVLNLRKEREQLIARQQADADGQRVRALQRENAQLNLKLKGLLTELEEIRAQREHQGLQSDNVTRLQTKQLAEHGANVKALQTEKDSLKLQVDNLQREIASTSDLHTQLTGRVHDLEKENIVLKNRVEETTHKSKVDMTNVKMEMLTERGDMERQKDKLLNTVEELKSQLEIMKHNCEQQGTSLVEKERDAARRVQAAHEEEWTKIHALENEKMELESKMQENERRRIEAENYREAEREKGEERLRIAHEAKETAEKDALVYKTKVTHQENLTQHLERERMDNSELKTRLHHIQTQYQSYISTENELEDLNSKLRNQISTLNTELLSTKNQLQTIEGRTEKTMAHNQASWLDEKHVMQRRIDELDVQMADMQTQLSQAAVSYKKKKRKFAYLVHKLKDKVTLYSAKIEQLEIERDALKKCVPANAHMDVQKKLRDLLRRHNEFHAVLMSSNVSHVPVGDLNFANVSLPLGVNKMQTNLGFFDASRDLDALKERLDQLDDHQKAQLRDLKGLSPSTVKKERPVRDTDRSVTPELNSDFESEENKEKVPDENNPNMVMTDLRSV